MTCDICKENNATGGAVIAGVYYESICQNDKAKLLASQSFSSGAARWNREMDAQDHEADIQQPYSKGKPNPAFIAAYPDKARQLFSQEQLRNATR